MNILQSKYLLTAYFAKKDSISTEQFSSLIKDKKTPKNRPVGEQHGIRHQDSEDRAWAADSRDRRVAPWQQIICQNDANSRAHATEEIELQEAPRAPQPLELGAEHPQGEHVEQDVRDAAVKERIGDQLPDIKMSHYVHGPQF